MASGIRLSTRCTLFGTLNRCVSIPAAHGRARVLNARPATVFGAPSLGRGIFRVAQRVVTTPVAQIEVCDMCIGGGNLADGDQPDQWYPPQEPSTTTSSSVCFKTTVGLAFGEVVKVVGGGDSLGNWDVEAAPGTGGLQRVG